MIPSISNTGYQRRSDLLHVVAKFREAGFEAHPTGSTLFYGEGKDLDVLIHGTGDAVHRLTMLGFEECSPHEYPDDKQWTGRKGGINVIVALQPEFFEAWLRSTNALCMLAYTGVVLDKDQRGVLFKAVVDSEDPATDLMCHAYATPAYKHG